MRTVMMNFSDAFEPFGVIGECPEVHLKLMFFRHEMAMHVEIVASDLSKFDTVLHGFPPSNLTSGLNRPQRGRDSVRA